VGETGSGKSTAARLMLRLLDPTAGTVRFQGEDVTRVRGGRLKALRREMQMIFQDPYSSLNPRKTVGSIIGEPFAIHRLHTGEGERRRAVQELMEQVGLNPEHYNRFPHEFSGGQRQRIGVARAVALRPKLIVADEPVSALDLSVVRHMCDRVAVMYLGKVVELADNDTLYSTPRHPYTGALLAAVPVPDPVLAAGRRRVALLAGDVPSPTNPPAACRFHTRCPKAQERCWTEEPLLERKQGGGEAACHFPLTADEIRERVPRAGQAA